MMIEPNDTAKRAAEVLADAIKTAISASSDVADAMDEVRELGYEPNVHLRLDLDMLMNVQDLTDRRVRLA